MGATTTINDIEKAFLKRLIKQYKVQYSGEKNPETKVLIISMIENLEKDLDRGTILVDQDESGDQQGVSTTPPTERPSSLVTPGVEPPKEKKKVNPKVFEPTVVVATTPVVITSKNVEKLDFLDDEEDGDGDSVQHHHVENDNMESEPEENDDDYDSGGNVVDNTTQPTKPTTKRTSFIDKVVTEQPPVEIVREEPPSPLVEEDDSAKKRKRDPIPKICQNCNALQVGNHITITVCRGKCLYFEMIESKLITPKMIKEMDRKRAAHENKFSAKGNDTTPQVEESGDEEKPKKKKKKKRSLKKKQAVVSGGDDDGSN